MLEFRYVTLSMVDFFFKKKWSWVFCYTYVCVTLVCLVPKETRRYQISWTQSYRWLWTTLRIEPRSSAGAASDLNHWALSLAQYAQYSVSVLESLRLSPPHELLSWPLFQPPSSALTPLDQRRCGVWQKQLPLSFFPSHSTFQSSQDRLFYISPKMRPFLLYILCFCLLSIRLPQKIRA